MLTFISSKLVARTKASFLAGAAVALLSPMAQAASVSSGCLSGDCLSGYIQTIQSSAAGTFSSTYPAYYKSATLPLITLQGAAIGWISFNTWSDRVTNRLVVTSSGTVTASATKSASFASKTSSGGSYTVAEASILCANGNGSGSARPAQTEKSVSASVSGCGGLSPGVRATARSWTQLFYVRS